MFVPFTASVAAEIFPPAATSNPLYVTALAVLVAVGAYVLGKIRPKPIQKERQASQWLLKCRELHSRGELSDEEYRTIKTNLASQPQDGLRDNGEEG